MTSEALATLAQRFASGEITEQEYQRRREILLNTQNTATNPNSHASSTGTTAQVVLPAEGDTLDGRYKLIKRAGQGGMGIVYQAQDTVESRPNKPRYIALKLLDPALQNDELQRQRFLDEAEASRQLRHHNIIGTYVYGESDIWLYITMEWLQGKSLKQLQAEQLRNTGAATFSWQHIKAWLPSLGAGLAHAHQQRVIHRDIKPANIFIEPDGRVVLLDFGIARVMSDTKSKTLTTQGETSGSLEYMPPEALIRGRKAQPQQDIYSLAVVVYELLVGETPFPVEICHHRTASHPMPEKPEGISEAEWQVLQQGLHAEPAERVPDYWEPKEQRQLAAKHWVEALLNAQAQYETRQAELKAAAAAREAKRQAEEAAKKAAKETRRKPGNTFQDGPNLPEMVVIPAGEFMMGSPSNETKRKNSEGPRHKVTIAKPFAVGKYPVTWEEWEACVAAKGCDPKGPESNCGDYGWGKGRRPVINVNWYDAKAYIAWLNKTTGKTYRLLTEAEWEYAARAGTATPFATGETITTDQANFDPKETWFGKRKGVYRRKTVPVGSFAANAFALHDMHGNVWEWVEDCWHDNYENAPDDGSAWLKADSGDCDRRVLRGGSWNYFPNTLRSANRLWTSATNRFNDVGFRLAQDI